MKNAPQNLYVERLRKTRKKKFFWRIPCEPTGQTSDEASLYMELILILELHT